MLWNDPKCKRKDTIWLNDLGRGVGQLLATASDDDTKYTYDSELDDFIPDHASSESEESLSDADDGMEKH